MRMNFIVPGAQSGSSCLAGQTSAPVRDGFPAVAVFHESWSRDLEALMEVRGRPVDRAYLLPHSQPSKILIQPVTQDPGNFDDPLEPEILADSSRALPGAMVFARRYPEGEVGAGWRFWMLRPSDKMWLSLHSGASTNREDLDHALGPFGMGAAVSFLDQVHDFGW